MSSTGMVTSYLLNNRMNPLYLIVCTPGLLCYAVLMCSPALFLGTVYPPLPDAPPAIHQQANPRPQELVDTDVQRDITERLNEIWNQSESQATYTSNLLSSNIDTTTQSDARLEFITAVALEKANNYESAQRFYDRLINHAGETPYGYSAQARKKVFGEGAVGFENAEETYHEIFEQDGTPGWFLVSDTWTWQTKTTAAKELTVIRKSDFSYRIFSYIRSYSTLPLNQAYLFILIVLSIGVNILKLPALLNKAKAWIIINSSHAEVAYILEKNSNNPTNSNKAIFDLLHQRGVNIKLLHSLIFVDLIFIIWVIVAMGSYAPQMVLDGADFFWIRDITQFNFALVICWMGVGFILHTMLSRMGHAACLTMLNGGIVLGIAWFWALPAYIFVFWILLNALEILIALLMRMGLAFARS